MADLVFKAIRRTRWLGLVQAGISFAKVRCRSADIAEPISSLNVGTDNVEVRTYLTSVGKLRRLSVTQTAPISGYRDIREGAGFDGLNIPGQYR